MRPVVRAAILKPRRALGAFILLVAAAVRGCHVAAEDCANAASASVVYDPAGRYLVPSAGVADSHGSARLAGVGVG